ncbi:GntR family transcriptional regulator [Lapillicoccus sp.]|uniref:GntR family transcriptional regulator n=1 Tax=Lapillicoccus sp. TaxID=1909287 RepID=UPI0025D367BD|nr:GntR family transcriptional regulator [Lapillicoccus sp.]
MSFTMPPSAAARVYDRIKRDILDGQRPGGTFVTEGEIAEATGVSRTPVREALLRLEVEGLVRLYPKKGALVVPVTAEAAHDVLEARLVIEEWAAGAMWPRRHEVLTLLDPLLAAMAEARRAGDVTAFVEHDRHFHEVIVAAAGNSVLAHTYQALRDRQLTIVATQLRMSDARLDEALSGHRQLLDLLRSGTKAAYVRLTRTHVQGAIARLRGSR